MQDQTINALIFAAFLTVAQGAQAQEARPNPAGADLILKSLSGRTEFVDLVGHATARFSDLDFDGDNRLSDDDRLSFGRMAAAERRATTAARLLAADLDGDLEVTEAELRHAMTYSMRDQLFGDPRAFRDKTVAQRDRAVADLMKADADGSGRITLDEALTLPPLSDAALERATETHGELSAALRFDHDADGFVSRAEFEAGHVAFFRVADRNNDGVLAPDEINAAKLKRGKLAFGITDTLVADARSRVASRKDYARLTETHAVMAAAPCVMPKPSDGASLVAVSAGEAAQISNVALGSQDAVTRTAEVRIEAGNAPLYITLSSPGGTIWRFTGATARVERVVLTSEDGEGAGPMPRAGVTGLAGSQVSFTASRCLASFESYGSRSSRLAREQVERAAGREPDLMAGYAMVGQMMLPSDARRDPAERRSFSRGAEAGFASFHAVDGVVRVSTGTLPDAAPAVRDLHARLRHVAPGGVMEIESEAVISSLGVAPYEVLPQEAGLIQLLQAGALSKDSAQDFTINEKIRFPAGLQKVAFRMRDNVELPSGTPGLAEVRSAQGVVIDWTETTGSVR